MNELEMLELIKKCLSEYMPKIDEPFEFFIYFIFYLNHM